MRMQTSTFFSCNLDLAGEKCKPHSHVRIRAYFMRLKQNVRPVSFLARGRATNKNVEMCESSENAFESRSITVDLVPCCTLECNLKRAGLRYGLPLRLVLLDIPSSSLPRCAISHLRGTFAFLRLLRRLLLLIY